MKRIINFIFVAILFALAAMSTFALDSHYKNNLLNVELTQQPDNRVNVLLTFEKPYTEQVKVVYKTDNEYNILLPETYHSVTSVNSINALNVRSAGVKLVPYFNEGSGNGYTKILIKTTRPVIFNAHSSYVTTKIAKEDLLEQLENDKPVNIKPTTLSSKPVKAKPQAKKPAAPKTTAKKPATATASKKTVKAAKPAYKKPATVKSKPVTPKPLKKPAVKPAAKPVNKADIKPQAVQTPPLAIEPKPIAGAEPKAIPQTPQPVEAPAPKTIQDKIMEVAGSNYGVIALLALGTLLILGLLLKLFNKTTRDYTNLYNKTVSNTENTQGADIPDDMKGLSWQEKYKAMKNREEQHDAEELATQQAEFTNNIDNIYSNAEAPQEPAYSVPVTNMFAEVEPPQEFAPAYQEPEAAQNSSLDLESFSSVENFDDFSDISPEVDEITPVPSEDLSLGIDINETPLEYASNPISTEPSLINQSKISKTKGFYLIRYENETALVGYIKDKIFLIQTFHNHDQSTVQTRLTEKKRGEDIYLVRSDNNYKALVSVSKDEMKTLINL